MILFSSTCDSVFSSVFLLSKKILFKTILAPCSIGCKGISALNINQPNTAFIKDNSAVLPIALIATAGYKVWGNEKIAIIPNAKFNFRTSLAQANLGASMRYFLKDQTGLLRNGYVGASLWYNTNEALSAMIELNQPNYIVAFSYDFVTNTNRQTWLTTGAPEITLIYKKAIIRKCKDTDKDGICDKEDECIDVPGILAMKGCPDKDNDGIPDYKDECPDSAGLARFNGCPDKDNDTIPDHKDECPQIAGLPIFKGCPDMDNDSIPDKIDACPDVAGLPKFNGCPDSDEDGFPDKYDKCPTVPGVAALQGCPEEVKKPEIKKPEIVNPEIQNLLPQESMDKIPFVQFARKSYTITQDFKIILDKIGAYAQKYPTATFVLEGHTDNIGSSVDNIALSKNRVDAVMKYLLTHGISPDRISTDGHGEHRPISENTSEEGRAKNRRVEILIMDK